jgi:lysine 2,3-aminomutase
MRRRGRRTDGLTSYQYSNILFQQSEEGTYRALPFFVTGVGDLPDSLQISDIEKQEIGRVAREYPLRIPPFYLNLMEPHNPRCPIRRQAIPSPDELIGSGQEDPLSEKNSSPTPAFIQKYPGRGVFLVSNTCAMYCRFCNRKRIMGREWDPRRFRDQTLSHLAANHSIREVILSGGDPFMLPPDELDYIISTLRGGGRIATLRISTRMPVVHPAGVLEGHFFSVARHHPLWIIVHINHPKEVTAEFKEVVRRFRKAEATVVTQTVLLHGVNDCPRLLLHLFESLVGLGVKPYYLFQLDEVRGAIHFKVKIAKGVEIMRYLRQNASGLAMPTYALDITGGAGKVPMDHRYIQRKRGNRLYVQGPSGIEGVYHDDGEESRCLECDLCEGGSYQDR